MASFFQPSRSSGDPVIVVCNTSLEGRQVYCNTFIPFSERLEGPLQRFTLSISAVCLVLPVAVWLSRICRRWRHCHGDGDGGRTSSKKVSKATRESTLPLADLAPLASIKVFHPYEGEVGAATAGCEPGTAYLIPLPSFADPESSYPPVLLSPDPQRFLLGVVEIEVLTGPAIPVWANYLFNLVRKEQRVTAIILRTGSVSIDNDSLELVEELMLRLGKGAVPVILNCHHDSNVFDQVDFGLLGGIIIDNACILEDGGRRDYFRSANLRRIMTRSAEQRASKRGFFVGFHDVWDKPPSAAVICRAAKVAKHFEAVFEHGPGRTVSSVERVRNTTQALSAFEFLRKPETCELQKAWLEQKRKVHIGPVSAADRDNVACLDLDALNNFFPKINDQLQSLQIAGSKSLGHGNVPILASPNYVDRAPPRVDFWETSAEGDQVSPLGCLPLTLSATHEHHSAVLATQVHLQYLDMLHRLDESEVDKVIQQLRFLLPLSAQFHLVRLLIEGLVQGSVTIHRGLATGFTVPDTPVEFWGLADATRGNTQSSNLDIFLSRRSPDDTTTVLHVWLAHHGVSRVHRFEEELQLESACRAFNLDHNSQSLPLSIRVAIDRATPSETLFLLEQLQVANPGHQFKGAIEDYCKSTLLDGASIESWNDAHSRQFLEGSIHIRDLLAHRLSCLLSTDQTRLPVIDRLAELYTEVDKFMGDALRTGNGSALGSVIDILISAYDPTDAFHGCDYVDVNTDLFALIFFCALRKAALEDVYLEATDRCPIFSQPDQAAVFCELWVLGSQCELYFGMVPRALGQIVYDKHQAFLQSYPPRVLPDELGGVMTVFAKLGPASSRTRAHGAKSRRGLVELLVRFGALSVFCLPAMLDISLLTFLGRGLFMTAYMGDENIMSACYGLLVALLLSAGITGSAGSVGNYYLTHYAYGNMVHFHVQCLSGGFVLSVFIASIGALIFYLKVSFGAAMIFAAYHILIATYLNLLGIMATMHHPESPLPSGRMVLWRTVPLLFLSPVVSAFINRFDVTIYLAVGYTFLLLLLLQYRTLCRSWIGWMDNVPKLSEQDIVEWYEARSGKELTSDDTSEASVMISDKDTTANPKDQSVKAFRHALKLHEQQTFAHMKGKLLTPDPLIQRVDKGLPFINWLLRKGSPPSKASEPFSVAWFAQLSQAVKGQQTMTQGLKEHNIFMLSRFSTFDVLLSLGLFLACLMDRWVSIAMSVNTPPVDLFSHFTSRYAICFAMLYFCTSVMVLDVTLRSYWDISYDLPDGKLSSLDDVSFITRTWERSRRTRYFEALGLLVCRMMIVFGISSLLVWSLVKDSATVKLYYLYALAYTAIIIFQFNRCFTRDLGSHIASIIASAAVGFVMGCILHTFSTGALAHFVDVIALDTTAIFAAVLTTVWALRIPSDAIFDLPGSSRPQKPGPYAQPRLAAGYDRESAPKATGFGDINSVKLSPHHLSQVLETLRLSTHRLQHLQHIPSLAVGLFETSSTMLEDGRVQISTCPLGLFADHRLDLTRSLGNFEGGVLSIVIAVEVSAEATQLPEPIPLIIAESIVYHTAATVLSLGDDQATRISLLAHQDLDLRIEFELAGESTDELQSICRQANSQLLHHLCLGLAVDKDWSRCPAGVRRAILHRLLGGGQAPEAEDEPTRFKDICPHTSNFHLDLWLRLYEAASRKLGSTNSLGSRTIPSPRVSFQDTEKHVRLRKLSHLTAILTSAPMKLFQWTGVVLGGNSTVEREMWHQLRFLPHGARSAITWLPLALWRLCRHTRNFWIYAILIQHHNALAYISRLAQKGVSRTLQRNRLVVQMKRKAVTGFASRSAEDGSVTLDVFEGHQDFRPAGLNPVVVATYDENFRLSSRYEESKAGRVVSTYTYGTASNSRQPLRKRISTDQSETLCEYDRRGRISTGSIKHGVVKYSFRYFYRRGSRESNEVLKARFEIPSTPSKGSLAVYWGAPTARESLDSLSWIPSDFVCRIEKTIGCQSYITTVSYPHRRDPVKQTILREGDTSSIIPESWCPRLFEHEELLQLRPHLTSFENDDLLIHHRVCDLELVAKFCNRPVSWATMVKPSFWSYLRRKTVYRRVPSWWLRTELWSHWRSSGTLDALAACWMDEKILRSEPLLGSYWRARGSGRLLAAKAFLDRHIDQISAAINIDKDVSEVCMLPIKTADLYAMGLSRDANQMTTRPDDCFNDTENRISVIFNDTGCWPDAPGGVSNCRRDLVDGHSTIRNHVLAESANEYGIPRFQIERNIQSLKTLPLWGLDGRVPNHGLIDNLLESEVDEKIFNTHAQRDIGERFVPLLKSFVKGARSRSISRSDMMAYSDTVLDMFDYFSAKDYNKTWSSPLVYKAWIEAWLTSHDDPRITNFPDCFELQKPTMSDFREALGIFSSYFFIFSVQTPNNCPKVFQSTHHGVSSLFGVFLKHRRGATFGIWDHAILWRECCLNLSTAQSTLPIPVQSMVLSGIGLAMRLAYFHADVVLPCTPVFNPIWEADLGTETGQLGHRKQFIRKIDPIVNGVSNMAAFKPVDEVRTSVPTVVMLSNVQFIKDIKTAILAADVIVNKWGFQDYRLLVYGARDREPSYDIDMTKLIEACKLTENVILKGFGKPQEALEDAWLFMNSSLSEGLPLAIAEAALAGVPIVATAVGATALVLTDPDDPSLRYGEVVPPNDATALARAQVAILAMAGPWAKFAGDIDKRGSVLPHLRIPDTLTAKDVKWLSKRMIDKKEDRRKLGLLGRQVVLRGFHGKRYLREHEQMYWVQWHLAQMRATSFLGTIPTEERADDDTTQSIKDRDREGILTALRARTSRRKLRKARKDRDCLFSTV